MKKQKRSKAAFIWIGAVLIYICFFLWHNGLGNPLSDHEIEVYTQRILSADRNIDPSKIETFRTFLREDDGKPVIMVNSIQLYEKPLTVEGVSPNETSSELLARYNNFVMPYLFQRGSYPVMAGKSVADSLEIWGIKNAEKWTMGALVRYRSRRDMMDMATNPEFVRFHKYKFAAMEKTIVFPVTPLLLTGGLGKIVPLFLFSLAAFIHLVICIFRIRKTRADHG